MYSNATRRGVVAGIGLLGAAGATGAWSATSGPGFPAVKALLESYVAGHKLSGGVVSIQRRGKPVDFVSVGTLAFDTEARMAPDSLFRVYSMTKPIIGVATMILIQEGKLKLDQPLSDILPAFAKMSVIEGADVT
jgi:CubicO group peptidase (beta-lactamase class C family)